ncbi:MAG: UTP--glucose-1-phosphate uridylyltransferase [Bacillota bacterium]
MKVTKAVIPCAGLGTRFLPYTKACPKELLPIIDTPVLQLIVSEIVQAGITDILIIDNDQKTAISSHFLKNERLEGILTERGASSYASQVAEIAEMANFHFVEQNNPLGSAHAVSLCEEFACGEPVALLFGDDLIVSPNGKPAIGQLMEIYEKTDKTVIGCQKVAMENIPKYSSINITKDCGDYYEISGIVEKPAIEDAPSDIAGLGRYILSPEIFDYIRKTEKGAGGEYQITDSFEMMAQKGLVVAMEYEGRRYDTGNKSSYLEAVVDFALANEELSGNFKEYIKKVAEKL